MPAHTPTPWVIEVPDETQDGYPDNWNINHLSPTRAKYVASIPGTVHFPEAQANSRLIVKAPDMFDELTAIVTLLDQGCQLDPEFDGKRIKKLLADITGGEA